MLRMRTVTHNHTHNQLLIHIRATNYSYAQPAIYSYLCFTLLCFALHCFALDYFDLHCFVGSHLMTTWNAKSIVLQLKMLKAAFLTQNVKAILWIWISYDGEPDPGLGEPGTYPRAHFMTQCFRFCQNLRFLGEPGARDAWDKPPFYLLSKNPL